MTSAVRAAADLLAAVTPSSSPSSGTGTPSPARGSATVTTIKDAVTAAGLVVAAAFTYFKFIKGRVIGPRVRLSVAAAVASATGTPNIRLRGRARPPAAPRALELRVQVCICNEGQIMLRLPKDSEQLVTVRSLTRAGLEAATRPALGAPGDAPLSAASWARNDTYFARTNIIRDEGAPPPTDVRLEPGEDLRVGILFGVPPGHEAVAYLVVLNAYLSYRSWFRSRGQWWETRTVLVPSLEASTETEGA